MDNQVIFDPSNPEHRAIVARAIAAADVFGLGRITAAKEQLEMNDIFVLHVSDLSNLVFELGA